MSIRERWHELNRAAAPSASREQTERLFRRLDEAYSEAGRSYHTWRHIGECLDHLDRYAAAYDGEPGTSRVEYALFYHDVVYYPGREDNEAQSARFAAGELAGVISRRQIDAVSRLILATAHLADDRPTADDDPLAPVVVDIDLAILGADRARFLEYDAQIRAEYSEVPPQRFAAGRRHVLERFQERPRIYRTDFFLESCEARARDNIAHVLARFYSP